MFQNGFIYAFSYNINESELCKLESRHVFQKEEQDKVLFSERKLEPSHSAFIKKRLEVLFFSASYAALLQMISTEAIAEEDFKLEYLTLEGDNTAYEQRLVKLKEIGLLINGVPDVHQPKRRYALCYYEGHWCFGLLEKNSYAWREHKNKPRSFSNAININIAKALVNIASKADREKRLIDTCCGIGTVLLEACFAGQPIVGCDINWRVCVQSRENLAFFNYEASVTRCDVKDMKGKYDAAIIDLPYNLFSCADENTHFHIINSAKQLCQRMVIVSTSDITALLEKAGLGLIDTCRIKKRGKKSFERIVWVCESYSESLITFI